jgi:phage terminase small subunit
VENGTPKGLSKAGKRFWRQALKEFELPWTHDLARLKMACRCLDEIEADETVLKTEGRFIEDRFHQKREHPAAKSIRDNKTLFCRIIRELGLDLTTPEGSRPRRQY